MSSWKRRSREVKALGYEPSSEETRVRPKYVSPYNQTVSKGTLKRKAVPKGGIIKRGDSKDSPLPSGAAAAARRHHTVDELMSRISLKQATKATILISNSKLEQEKKRSKASPKKMVKKLTNYEEDLISSAFLTGGRDGNWDDDELTVGSADNKSSASQGTYGSYGSLKSAISVVETQPTHGGEKIKTFEVDMSTKGGGIVRQRLTLRTLIDNIESRARENLLPPLYVPELDDLPSTMVSWNGKNNFKPSKKMIERKRRQDALNANIFGNSAKSQAVDEDMDERSVGGESIGSLDGSLDDSLDGSIGAGSLGGSSLGGGPGSLLKKPRVDIIGMYQSVPLILARADERCRKREKALEAKNHISEEKRKQVMELIQHKMSRPERYAEALRIQQMQVAWLKIIPALIYNQNFVKVAPKLGNIAKRNKQEFWAIMTLTQAIKKFLKFKWEKKVKSEFLHRLQSSIWVLSLAIRKKRKQFAVRRLKYFFSLFEGKNRIKFVIHRFVNSAHRLQKVIRNFVQCTRARKQVLLKIWNQEEHDHIYEVLEKRRQMAEESGLKQSKSADQPLVKIDKKMEIEMNKQAERWKESEAKMNALLERHRKSGLIGKVDLREVAEGMILDIPEKDLILSKFLRDKRLSFIVQKQEEAKTRIKDLSTYGASDAADLLKGDTEKIDETVRRRMHLLSTFGSAKFAMGLFHDAHSDEIGKMRSFFKKKAEILHRKQCTFVVKKAKNRGRHYNSTRSQSSPKKPAAAGPGKSPLMSEKL